MANTSDDESGSPRTLSTLQRATEIIELLMHAEGATVVEIADRLDMSKSSVYNYVTTLYDDGWLVKRGSTYYLSLKLFRFGAYVRTSSTLFETARPEMDDLADETTETVHLSTIQHNHQIHLYKAHGAKAVGDEYHRTKLHTSAHLHDTATGKAILAALPREDVEDIIEVHGLLRKTDQTITDRESLFERLEVIEERGYAYNDEEEIEGLRAAGTPIRNRGGDVLGSISVSGPTRRLQGDRFHSEIPELVMQTANVIELNINMEYRLEEEQV